MLGYRDGLPYPNFISKEHAWIGRFFLASEKATKIVKMPAGT